MDGFRGSVILTSALMMVVLLRGVSSAAIPGFQECILNNHRYTIGEVFHPVVQINRTEQEAVCFECVCQPTAIAQCEQVICPPADCLNPIRLAGQCCLFCIAPPVLTTDDSCLFEGIQINHGDVFRPTSILDDFTSDRSVRDECVECTCDNTVISCHDVSADCRALSCNDSEAVFVEGECCKRCPAIIRPPASGPGCHDFDGNFFSEGQWWHPSLPNYGVVTCVNCTCQESNPRCWRLPCPDVPPCGPDDPVEDVVVCCPRCNPNVPPIPTETTTSDSSNITTPAPIIDFTPDITPCENRYIYKIYRHTQSGHDVMALQNLETNMVTIYNWTTVVGPEGPTVNREYSEVDNAEFLSDEMYTSYFHFVGWTIERRVNGLSNKESKRERIRACTENCARMVVNMLRPVATLSETLECGRR